MSPPKHSANRTIVWTMIPANETIVWKFRLEWDYSHDYSPKGVKKREAGKEKGNYSKSLYFHKSLKRDDCKSKNC